MPSIERIVLRPEEAAAMLGVSTRTLREYKARGLIAYRAVGRGRVSYLEADILAFLESAKRQHRPAEPLPMRQLRLTPAPTRAGTNPVTGLAWGAHLSRSTAAAAAGARPTRATRGGSRQR
jgi:hypothetical protein